MRWMLTAEPFDATEAHRIGLIAGEDARIGLESFINRTTAEFAGR